MPNLKIRPNKPDAKGRTIHVTPASAAGLMLGSTSAG